jgi:hypothetical protein
MTTANITRGIRKATPAPITIAAAATPETLWIRTTNALTGSNAARTVILRKLMAYNAVGATTLTIGYGLGGGFVALFPPFRLVNNMDNEWNEIDIPEVEYGGNLTIQSDVLGVVVSAEVEEIGA